MNKYNYHTGSALIGESLEANSVREAAYEVELKAAIKQSVVSAVFS